MPTMIETKDLTFTYPAPEGETNPPALRGVSLAVEKGSFVVVLGHNGSGKSTLAKHMNAVLLPDGGAVAMDGTPRQVFARVEELHSFGLAAPDTVELLHELAQAGLPVALDSLTVDQCADTICRALGAAEGK